MFNFKNLFQKKFSAFLSAALALCILSVTVPVGAVAAERVEMKHPKRFLSANYDVQSLEDEDLDELEDYIFEHLYALDKTIDISKFKIETGEDNSNLLFYLIWYQMPEAFHVDSLGMGSGKYIETIYVTYNCSAEEYRSMYAEFSAAADKLLAGIEGNNALSDAEKALLLHDRLAVWNEYDYKNLLSGTVPKESYTAYGALVNRTSVCDGYTKAYMYLLSRAGIESLYCSSEKLGHSWNIAEIDGELYHIDVTWDDPVYDITGRVYHNNFLLSTEQLKKEEHNASDFVDLPTDTKYDNYYWRNSNTEFQLLGDALYYIDNQNQTLNRVQNGSETTLTSVEDMWLADENSFWLENQVRLSNNGKNLLFSLHDAVYEYDINSGAKTVAFKPDLSVGSYFGIYGFTYSEGYFICDLSNTPNFEADTKQRYQVRHLDEAAEPEVTLSSIAITSMPQKTLYNLGEELDTEGLELTLTFSDGSTETITEGFTTMGFDSSSVGTKTVTVNYGGKTASFDVEVKKIRGTTGGCTWTLRGTELTVSGNTDTGTDGSYEWGDTITSAVIEPGVTGLGDRAFARCKDLQTVIIPESVTNFGIGVFDGCDNLTLKVLPNSAAHDYAVKNGIKFELIEQAFGDINGDGTADLNDAILAARAAVGNIELSETVIKIADVNGDGSVTIADALLIARVVGGVLDKLPVQR